MEVRNRRERWIGVGVLVTALVVAIISAKPYAVGWNDGSRLATVDSLVDRGTLAVDDSIFIRPAVEPCPYAHTLEVCRQFGSRDKLFINGHFYSDKSPVPAFGMAAVYQIWRWASGPSAAERPDLFCLLMNFVTAGLAYIIAVYCIFAIGGTIGLDMNWRLAFTAFFALGTVALPYAQHVNNHVMLLAVAALLFLLALKGNREGWTVGLMLGIGTVLGIGYTIDLAAGPMLALAFGGMLISHPGPRRRLTLAVAAGLPWFLFHHVVNYRTAGTFGPANAVPEYLAWPGSPFNAQNMTGGWNHKSIGKAALYALDLLFGKKGFLGHNLLLFLPLALLPRLVRNAYPERRIVIAGLVWAVGTWLLYAATSTNASGGCCSVRWLVPLLIPGFVALAVVLRDYPSMRMDAIILGAGGTLFGFCMAFAGLWSLSIIPGYWAAYAGTLVVWGSYRFRCWRAEARVVEPRESSRETLLSKYVGARFTFKKRSGSGGLR